MGAPSRTAADPPLAQRIKALRRRLGLSAEQFGRLFFVSPRTVEEWEQGRRRPRGLTLRELQKEMAKRSGAHRTLTGGAPK
jgi:DNA-binding transcriptional regulator YiaG